MKPQVHASMSAAKYGGLWQDYIDIHDFIDSSKAHLADVRHRAMFHNSYGCYLVELIFGHQRINSDSKFYNTRDIAEDHIAEDLGKIPTVADWLRKMPIEPWMGQPITKVTVYKPTLEEPLDLK